MRHILSFITAATIAFSSTGYPAGQTATAAPTGPVAARTRIGVFDSRAVALAYYNTPEFQAELRRMTSDLAAAKAANDKSKVEALEFQGPAVQNLLHYQVFSTASIPNVLEKLSSVLPRVAADARLSAIVSKWDVAFKNGNEVEYIDVTDQLVAAFNPSTRIQQMIAQTKAQTPMPLFEAVKTMRPDR